MRTGAYSIVNVSQTKIKGEWELGKVGNSYLLSSSQNSDVIYISSPICTGHFQANPILIGDHP